MELLDLVAGWLKERELNFELIVTTSWYCNMQVHVRDDGEYQIAFDSQFPTDVVLHFWPFEQSEDHRSEIVSMVDPRSFDEIAEFFGLE